MSDNPTHTSETDYPLTETLRLKVAYLFWQANEGHILAEDRAVGENWMLGDPAEMHEDDARALPGWLDMADIVLAAIADEVVVSPGSGGDPDA